MRNKTTELRGIDKLETKPENGTDGNELAIKQKNIMLVSSII